MKRISKHIFAVLVILYFVASSAVIRGKPAVDPAPLSVLLNDSLSAIQSEDYSKAISLINTALNIDLPEPLNYRHKKLYTNLKQLIELIPQAEKLAHSSSSITELKTSLYKLNRAKIDFIENTRVYINILMLLFKDDLTKNSLSQKIKATESKIIEKLDLLIKKLTEIYIERKKESGQPPLNITITSPPSIEPESKASAKIVVEPPAAIYAINLTIRAEINARTIYEKSLSTYPGIEYTISFRVPKAEELDALQLLLGQKNLIKVLVKASALYGGILYTGFSEKQIEIKLKRPQVKFSIPPYVRVNETLNVKATADIESPLNFTVYVDRTSVSTLIMSGQITPGKNEISIPMSRISPGNHTIIFHTSPQGCYGAMSWAKIVTVYKEPQKDPKAFVAIDFVSIGPPFILKMHGTVNCSQPYTVVVYISGSEVLRTKLENNSFSLSFPMPSPLLIQKYEVEYRIIPQDASYESVRNRLEVYAINLPPLFLLTLLGSAITAAPPITTHIVSSIRKIYGKSSQRAKSDLKKSPSRWTASLRYKKPRLLNLYRKFLKIIKTVSGPARSPRKSETLREFIYSIKICKPIRELASEFIRLYEVDLYSQHETDARKAGEIINEFEKKARE